MPNACKSNVDPSGSEWRTAEYHVRTYLPVGDNGSKDPLIPHNLSGAKLSRWKRGVRPIRLLVR